MCSVNSSYTEHRSCNNIYREHLVNIRTITSLCTRLFRTTRNPESYLKVTGWIEETQNIIVTIVSQIQEVNDPYCM